VCSILFCVLGAIGIFSESISWLGSGFRLLLVVLIEGFTKPNQIKGENEIRKMK